MSNKKLGNRFEEELAEILSEEGFWCHLLAQNSAGQPADLIAVKYTEAFLIDCKVCSNGFFAYNRIEDNQETAMELWKSCGNGSGWFALKFGEDDIYMVSDDSMHNARNHLVRMDRAGAAMYGCSLEDWLWYKR